MVFKVTETLLSNARKVIAQTKSDNMQGKIIPEDQMLAFALADAVVSLAEERAQLRAALKVFADCAVELEATVDTPRAPDGEWAKFRLLTDDYRRAAQAMGSPDEGGS